MSGKSWLDNDPEWRALRDRIEGRNSSTQHTQQQTQQTSKHGSASPHEGNQPINKKSNKLLLLVTPLLKKATTKTTYFIKRRAAPMVSIAVKNTQLKKINTATLLDKRVYATGAVGAAIIGVFVVTNIVSQNGTDAISNQPIAESGVLATQSVEPEYDVLEPKNDNTKERSEVRYTPERKVASYTDKIGLTTVTVSMQPLPGAFEADPSTYVEKLAGDFYANERISESNPVAFTGKNAENGVQTTIFAKNGLLVFILAQQEIDRTDLATYITTLE